MEFNLISIISTIFGVGGLGVGILAWIRFHPTDVAKKNKLNAEAQEIRAKADVLITDGALRIVDRLSSDLDEARDEIERLIKIVAELKELYEKAEAQTSLLQSKLNEAKTVIETKRRHCIETKSRILQLQELLLLKQQGLTQQQLEDFIARLNELINSTPSIPPINLSS